jgi:hypothetical protein
MSLALLLLLQQVLLVPLVLLRVIRVVFVHPVSRERSFLSCRGDIPRSLSFEWRAADVPNALDGALANAGRAAANRDVRRKRDIGGFLLSIFSPVYISLGVWSIYVGSTFALLKDIARLELGSVE